MTSHVPGFDDGLIEALTAEAATVGESVDTFISRAVAARLVLERTKRGDPHLTDLLVQIAQAGLGTAPASDPAPDTETEAEATSVVFDPDRLRVLYETGLLDSEPDAAYDRIVQIAAEALAVPTAAVSLVDRDRQFFTSAVNLPGEWAASRQTPLERSICRTIVESGEPLIVEDARIHPTLKDHLTVLENSLVAYAGFPLTDSAGHTIGTLCVWDSQPRQWSSGHVQILKDLSQLVRRKMFDIND